MAARAVLGVGEDLPAPAAEDTKTPGLCGEAKYLGVPKLPTVVKS